MVIFVVVVNCAVQSIRIRCYMDSSVFLSNMLDAFDDRVDEFTLETRFREISEWDSLASVSTVAMIYAEYDVQISGAELTGCETLNELMSLVQNKIESPA